jgi:hypothetical protein
VEADRRDCQAERLERHAVVAHGERQLLELDVPPPSRGVHGGSVPAAAQEKIGGGPATFASRREEPWKALASAVLGQGVLRRTTVRPQAAPRANRSSGSTSPSQPMK